MLSLSCQKLVGGKAKWVVPWKKKFKITNGFFKNNICTVKLTLFPWSKGDGEWGVGNIEVAFPSIPDDNMGDPQPGDVDKRPTKNKIE